MPFPKEIALEFVNGINAHDVGRLCRIMSEDHVFINSLGSRLQGRDKVKAAWLNYFEMFPDYTMHCTDLFERGVVVAIFGRVEGSHRALEGGKQRSRWEIPAAWKAVVRQDKLHSWQVFADNEPVRRFLAGANAARRLSRVRTGFERRRGMPRVPSE